MSISKSQEEFEAWFRENHCWAPEYEPLAKNDDGYYLMLRTHERWTAWQASRAALVIELPALSEFYPDQYCPAVAIDEGSDLAIIECREAIEAAGVKCK